MGSSSGPMTTRPTCWTTTPSPGAVDRFRTPVSVVVPATKSTWTIRFVATSIDFPVIGLTSVSIALICPICLIGSPEALNHVVTRPSSWPDNVATNVPQSNSPSNGSLKVNTSRVRCPAPAAVAAMSAITAATIAIENRCMSLPWSAVRQLSHVKPQFPAEFLGPRTGDGPVPPTLVEGEVVAEERLRGAVDRGQWRPELVRRRRGKQAGPGQMPRPARLAACLRELRVGSATAGRGARHTGALRASARFARSSLVMWGLNDRVDGPLVGVHVVEPVVSADRLGVCRCSGAVPRTGERHTGSAWRPLHLPSERGSRAQDCENNSASGDRQVLAAHRFLLLPLTGFAVAGRRSYDLPATLTEW